MSEPARVGIPVGVEAPFEPPGGAVIPPRESTASDTRVAEVVRLSVPCELGFIIVVRLTAAAVGQRFGFDIEEIADLRVAVDELASVVVEASNGGVLTVALSNLGDAFVVEGSAPVATRPFVDDLTYRILSAVVDEFDVSMADDVTHFHILKRAGTVR